MRVTFQCAAEYWCTYTHEDNPWGWRKNYPRGGHTVLVLLLITTSQTGKFNDSFGTMLKLVRYWGQHSPSLSTVLILPKKIIKAKPKRIKLFVRNVIASQKWSWRIFVGIHQIKKNFTMSAMQTNSMLRTVAMHQQSGHGLVRGSTSSSLTN